MKAKRCAFFFFYVIKKEMGIERDKFTYLESPHYKPIPISLFISTRPEKMKFTAPSREIPMYFHCRVFDVRLILGALSES